MLDGEAGVGNMLGPSIGAWYLGLGCGLCCGHSRACPQRWLRNSKMELKSPEVKLQSHSYLVLSPWSATYYPEKADRWCHEYACWCD